MQPDLDCEILRSCGHMCEALTWCQHKASDLSSTRGRKVQMEEHVFASVLTKMQQAYRHQLRSKGLWSGLIIWHLLTVCTQNTLGL